MRRDYAYGLAATAALSGMILRKVADGGSEAQHDAHIAAYRRVMAYKLAFPNGESRQVRRQRERRAAKR